jgi:hypothetical protein
VRDDGFRNAHDVRKLSWARALLPKRARPPLRESGRRDDVWPRCFLNFWRRARISQTPSLNGRFVFVATDLEIMTRATGAPDPSEDIATRVARDVVAHNRSASFVSLSDRRDRDPRLSCGRQVSRRRDLGRLHFLLAPSLTPSLVAKGRERWPAIEREIMEAAASIERHNYCFATWQPDVTAPSTPIVVEGRPI